MKTSNNLKDLVIEKEFEQNSLFYIKLFSILFLFGFIWFLLQRENLFFKHFKKEYLIFNLLLVIFLITIFLLFSKVKKEKMKILLIFLISIFFFLIPFKRDFSQCGDAPEWIWVSTKNYFYGSEILSNFVHYIFHNLLSWFRVAPEKSLGYVSSSFGILYLLSVYFLSKTILEVPVKQNLFFALALSTSSTGFFIRYPENPFLALPFLIFSLNYAIKYTTYSDKSLKYLFLYTLFFAFACLFHGFALSSLPFYVILPFIKMGSKRAVYNILIFLLSFIFIILLTWNILKFLGFLMYHHHAGFLLGRTYPFVDAFQQSKFYDFKLSFFSKIHISGILFSFLISFPLAFFILPFTLKIKEISKIELILCLMALFQLIFIVFWNPDLGIWRDIDLFVTPSFFISLVYVYFITKLTYKSEKSTIFVLLLSGIFSGIPFIVLG